MTPLLTINLLRVLFISFAMSIGIAIGSVILGSGALGAMIGLVFGLVIVLIDRTLKGFSLRTFSSATFGLLLGWIFAQLLLASDLLKYQSDEMRWVMSLAIYATFGYLGMMLAIRSNRDEFSLIIPYVRFQQTGVQDAPLLIDTNIIIDGRISALCATGFVSGSLIVPRFVLDELHRLADSAEPLKRERGRRGLDLLGQMQKRSPDLTVTIYESVSESDLAVDTRLVQTARVLQARLLTNDVNLSKTAALQHVPVLSLAELEKALRPSLNAGDEVELTLVREGRDVHQAVGYLPDGTMIVVNNARQQIGKTVPVTVASALQTSGGRLFFAELAKRDTAVAS
ncbi:MAG: twitching motility protein PilT [Verrucomicrobiota bacterium]|nr:twitching motility protein PilT [Verrucomicrobiota bacterium]